MPAGFEVPAIPEHIGNAEDRLQLAVHGRHVLSAGLCTALDQLARTLEDSFPFERASVGLVEGFAA